MEEIPLLRNVLPNAANRPPRLPSQTGVEQTAALVFEARSAGLELTVGGADGLGVRHKTDASPDEELLARLADHKPEIIAELQQQAAPVEHVTEKLGLIDDAPPVSEPVPMFALCLGGCGGRTVNIDAAGLCEVCSRSKREVPSRAETGPPPSLPRASDDAANDPAALTAKQPERRAAPYFPAGLNL